MRITKRNKKQNITHKFYDHIKSKKQSSNLIRQKKQKLNLKSQYSNQLIYIPDFTRKHVISQ